MKAKSPSTLQLIKQELRDAYRYRYVTYSFVQTNLKLRYRRSVLGFVWTVLAPMLHYVVIGFVFSMLMAGKREDYFAYYFSGALFFSMISGVLNRAPMVFIANEHFIKKIYVPKIIFVLNAVSIEVINFCLSATALIVLGMLSGQVHLSPLVILSIVPVILIAIGLLGIACFVSVAAVYFRDLLHIVPVVIQALFFLTPVVYDKTMIPEKYHWIVQYNPFYYFLQMFRMPLIEGGLPSPLVFAGGLVFSLVVLVVGLVIVKKFDNRIVFKL